MSDPKKLLERAAPWPEEELDMGPLRLRVRRRQRARWVRGSLAILVVAASAAVAVETWPGRSGPVDVTTRPDLHQSADEPSTPLLTDVTPVAVVAAGPRPERIVGATREGAVVVVDARSGATVRELVPGPDPDAPLDNEGPGPNTVGDLALSQDGRVAYVASVGEPACGDTRSIQLSGVGGPEEGGLSGSFVATSPDGRHVATSGCSLIVMPGPDGGTTAGMAEITSGGCCGGRLAWSADGRHLAVERGAGAAASGPTEILVFDLLTARTVADALVLRDPEGVGYRSPAFRRDGRLVVAQQLDGANSATARVLDPITGTVVASFEYGGAVRGQAYDATHTWLLVTMADGTLRWFGGGEQGTLPFVFTSADW